MYGSVVDLNAVIDIRRLEGSINFAALRSVYMKFLYFFVLSV